jgi:hypothetical protein
MLNLSPPPQYSLNDQREDDYREKNRTELFPAWLMSDLKSGGGGTGTTNIK